MTRGTRLFSAAQGGTGQSGSMLAPFPLVCRVAVGITAALALSGCLAKTAVDVVTLPVRVASAGVDAVTTSQSEADEKRGREARLRDERIGKLQRERARWDARCANGDQRACDRAGNIEDELHRLTGTTPD